MVLPHLTDLIDQCRRMIGDTPDAPTTRRFIDEEIQAALLRRTRHLCVDAAPLGATPASMWRAPTGGWDRAATINADATPALDLLGEGIVTFDPPYDGPVSLDGDVHDLAAAAADLLEEWAASLARGYDVRTAGGEQFTLSQRAKGLLAAADQMRSRSWPQSVHLERVDIATGNSTGNHPGMAFAATREARL